MPDPIQIRMGGYGPASTGFSRALKSIGDRLTAEFGDRVDVKYVWNIMELGYRAEDILWLVEHGLLTLGYQSSSYLTDRVPDLGIADLPFLFARTQAARAAMDGALGDLLARKIEERLNYRVLGWFENGFRHISNRVREVRASADLAGLRLFTLLPLCGLPCSVFSLPDAVLLEPRDTPCSYGRDIVGPCATFDPSS